MAAVRVSGGAPGIDGDIPTVGITGHRDLSADSQRWVRGELRRVLRKLQEQNGAQLLRCGMAMGADLIAAEVAQDVGIAVWAHMPYPGQAGGWDADWAARHSAAVAAAAGTSVAGDGADRRSRVRQLHARNRAIVDGSGLMIAVWDRRPTGGTAATVRYAKGRSVPVVTIDPDRRTVTAHR